MREIDSFRYGHSQRLRKAVTNDRSKPMLTKIKIKGKVSSNNRQQFDLLHEH